MQHYLDYNFISLQMREHHRSNGVVDIPYYQPDMIVQFPMHDVDELQQWVAEQNETTATGFIITNKTPFGNYLITMGFVDIETRLAFKLRWGW